MLLRKQGETSYKVNPCCCYFDIFLHFLVRILLGCPNEKKWWLAVDLWEDSALFWVLKLSSYRAMAVFLHILGTPKEMMISNYSFIVGYLHFLRALIDKRAQNMKKLRGCLFLRAICFLPIWEYKIKDHGRTEYISLPNSKFRSYGFSEICWFCLM